MGKPYYTERFEKQLAQIINETLLFKIKDQRISATLINVTRIKLNKDRSIASVFVRTLEENKKNKAIKLLYHCRPFFLRAIREKLHIKRYPQLRFLFDDDRENQKESLFHLLDNAPNENL